MGEPTAKNDVWKEETNIQKAANMKKSFRFILDFFSESNWLTIYRGLISADSDREIEVKRMTTKHSNYPILGAIRIRVTRNILYAWYKLFMKDFYKGSQVIFVRTFFEKLEDLGIYSKRRQYIKGIQLTCCDIHFSIVKAHLQRLFPGCEMPEWPSERKIEGDRLIRDCEAGVKYEEFEDDSDE